MRALEVLAIYLTPFLILGAAVRKRLDHENRSYSDIGRRFWAFWLAGFGDADDRDGFDSGTG